MLLNLKDIEQDLVTILQYCEDTEALLLPLKEQINNGPPITATLFELLTNFDQSGKVQEHLFRQLINENGHVKEEFQLMGRVDEEVER